MQVVTIAEDGTVRIEFTAEEAKQLRRDIEENRAHATSAGKELVRYVDTLYGEVRPTFPDGGF